MDMESKAEESPSLRSVLQELDEINDMIRSSENKLEYTVNGNADEEVSTVTQPEIPDVKMDSIQTRLNTIRQRASRIQTLVASLLGN